MSLTDLISYNCKSEVPKVEGREGAGPGLHIWSEPAFEPPGIRAPYPKILGKNVLCGESQLSSLYLGHFSLYYKLHQGILRVLLYSQNCMSLCFTILPALLMVFRLSYQ